MSRSGKLWIAEGMIFERLVLLQPSTTMTYKDLVLLVNIIRAIEAIDGRVLEFTMQMCSCILVTRGMDIFPRRDHLFP